MKTDISLACKLYCGLEVRATHHLCSHAGHEFMMAWGLDPQSYAAILPTTDAKQNSIAVESTSQPIATPPPYAFTTNINNTEGEGAHLRKRSSAKSETQGLYPNGTQVYVNKYGELVSGVSRWQDGQMMIKLLQGVVSSQNPRNLF